MTDGQNRVFLALQLNDETRPIIEAIEQDNPHAEVNRMPAMVKIDAPKQLVLRRRTVEDLIGDTWDMRSLSLNLISLSGNVEETEDQMILHWNV